MGFIFPLQLVEIDATTVTNALTDSNPTAATLDIATVAMNATALFSTLTALNASSISTNAAASPISQPVEIGSNQGDKNVPRLHVEAALSDDECFSYFNPVTGDSYESTVRDWADAILALAKFIPNRL
jgi:hypothetical protein